MLRKFGQSRTATHRRRLSSATVTRRVSPTSSTSPVAPAARSSLRVALVFETDDLKPTLRRWLDRELKRMAALAGVVRGAITLVLVDDEQMAQLHGQYKNDPTTTDVLTFDLRDGEDDPLEGDLILCIDEAARQAAARGHDTRMELLLYAVHGLLHLIGYDDVKAADYRRMHAKEDELFTAAGHGAVFKTVTSSGGSRGSRGTRGKRRPP